MYQPPSAYDVVPGQYPPAPPTARRPGTVTTAAVIMFVLTGLSVLGMAGALFLSTRDEQFARNPAFLMGLWFVVLAGATLPSAIMVLGGKSAGRTVAILVLGGAAVLGMAFEAQTVVQNAAGNDDGSAGVIIGISIVLVFWLFFTLTPVLLIMGPRATGWFREQGRQPPTADPPGRPIAFYLSLGLLGVLILLVSIRIGRFLVTDFVSGFDSSPAGAVASLAVPLLPALAGFGWLAAGRDFGRSAAVAACGYYFYVGLNWLATVVVQLALGFDAKTDQDYWIHFILAQAGMLAAVGAVVALSAGQVERWLAQRRLAQAPAR